MADRSTIARPYARAAFEEARSGKRLGPWADAINTGAAVVQDSRVQRLLDHPRVTPAELAQLVIGIADGSSDQDGVTPVKNFVQTLAENRRLGYLPEIAEIFNELKDAEEGIVDVTVTSAAPLDQSQQLSLTEALARKLTRQVCLHPELDPTLIGGAVLRAGDLVIDGSLRTRLNRIATELTA
jgi:F-type H+-transporting ATPase subunit delta